MRAWLEFHKKRRFLEKNIEKISRGHSTALKRLKFPTYDDKARLHSEYWSEQQLYEDELAVLTSNYFASVARRMFMPVPEFKTGDGIWEEAHTTGRYHLNTETLSALRSAIRKEQKEKHELWVIWLAAVTGLVGAITGLAAVLGE